MVLRIYLLLGLFLLMGTARSQNLEIDSLKRVLEKESNLDGKVDLYDAIGFKAMIYSREEAEYYQIKLDSVWKTYKHPKARLLSHKLKAKILRWNDQPRKALQEFIKVLDLKPDSSVVADVYFNLGIVYSSLRLNDNAISSYQEALKLYKTLKISDQIHNIYNCLADVYNYNLRDYDLAEKYYLHALSSYSYLDETRKMNTLGLQSLSAIHNNMGVLYSSMGKYGKSEEHLKNSMAIAEEMKDSLGVFHCRISLAQLFRRQSLYTKSFPILKQIEGEYKKYLPYLQAEFLREWTATLAGVGQFKKAYEFTDEYALVRDTLYNTNLVRQVSRVEQEFQQKLNLEQSKIEVEKQRNRNLFLIVVSVSALVFVQILGLLYFRYRFKIRKQEIQNLQAKNRELLSDAMKQSGFSSVLDELSIDLKNFGTKEKLQKGSRDRLDDIIKKIAHSHTQFQWEDFEMLFTRVYSDFFTNLDRKHSNLSLSERKLCALIKLDLSNFDISKFLNIELQSVHVSKSRLKKKMDLDKSIDLYYYTAKF